ncbi:unnamed protein product [Mucor hiemalis]
MRFSLFNLSLLIFNLWLLLTITTTSATNSVKIQGLNRSNFTVHQYLKQDQYNFNSASTDESVASSLRRKFVLGEKSTSMHVSKDPIFALVVFVALSSLLF